MAQYVMNTAGMFGYEVDALTKVGLQLYGATPILKTLGIVFVVIGAVAFLCAKKEKQKAKALSQKNEGVV